MKLNSLIKTIKATWLCIRFPFLYPRNRWTGKHYNNWRITKFHTDNYGHAVKYIYYGTHEITGEEELKTFSKDKKNNFLAKLKEDSIIIYYESFVTVVGTIPLSDLTDNPKSVKGVEFSPFGSLKIYVEPGTEIKENGDNGCIEYIKDDWLYKIILFLDKVEDILGFFHILPQYTELGALNKGWRKAWGIDLCKDIKKWLKQNGGKIFITQIKEKNGYLHFYYNGPIELQKEVLAKYEEKSGYTCIKCGKPATHVKYGYAPYGVGWLEPVCPDCSEITEWDAPVKDYWEDTPEFYKRREELMKQLKEKEDKS